MNLSERQSAAVARIGQDVCVVAGPGSGKTRVLVERFAWLIRERHVSPRRILAITFTEKAATEIKRRLAGEFAVDPGLREQVERAYVSTVHGFCGRLLREHPIQAGLDPDFLILDEPESARLLQDAAHSALDALYQERRPQMRRLLNALYVSTREGARQPDTAEALTNIYQALRTAGRSVADLRQEVSRPVAGLTLAEFVAELRSLLASAPASPTPKQAECIGALGEWARQASAMSAGPVGEAHFKLLDDYPSTTPRGNAFEGYAAMKNDRCKLVESSFAAEYFRPLKDLLLDALESIDAAYRTAKAEAGGLDFSDLEERAIELLTGDGRVLEEVRNEFDQVLMDELQDTNPLQWRLVNLLRRPGSFFAVGDVNQSIYGFRYAAPDAFVHYREQVSSLGGSIDELFENYRSRAGILAAAQRVLEGAPGVEARSLEARRKFGPIDEPPVEVIAAPGEGKDAAERAEARAVARRIAELVGRLPVQDGEDRQRPLRFHDVAVLARTVRALPPLEEAFREAGIPYLTEGGRTFFETREARDLAMLLKLIADPGDGVALAGVLRSPLVGIGDESLLRLKLGLELPEGDDRERLDRFQTLLAGLREEAEDVSPDILLARALDACNYEDGLDTRARAGVDKFMAIVRGLSQRRPESLRRLVEDLDWQRSVESEAEAPPDDSADMVRVMTIHKAKGLEFPVVFLPALHRGSGGNGPTICLAPQGGLGVHWRNPVTGGGVKDPAFVRGEQDQQAREAAEENRLLFVAMTRAEERLVLSFARTPKPQGPHWQLIEDRLHVTREAGIDEPPGVLSTPSQGAAGETTLVAAPLLTGQYDFRAAVTSLDLFARCPRRYFLSRYLGCEGTMEAPVGDPRPAGPNAAEFGSLVHRLLAGETVNGAPDEVLELVRRFQAGELGERVARARRIEREFDFAMAVEDVVLSGQIDLWFEEGGELVLVDYKTDRIEPGAAAARAEAYSLQLRLYALALGKMMGRTPERAFLCFLRTGEAVPVSLDVASLDRAAGCIRSFKEAQNYLRFELREGEQCRYCPFHRGLCPAGRVG